MSEVKRSKEDSWIFRYAIITFIILAIYFAVNFFGNEEQIPTEMGFEESLQFVLKWEGGYFDDPNDPGGETNFGISKRAYPDEDIKNMTIERATKIYYKDYWLTAGCDEMEFPYGIIVFDTGVNMGVGRANDFLKKSENWQDYLLIRIQFYSELDTAKYFLRGWVNRVVDLYILIEKQI